MFYTLQALHPVQTLHPVPTAFDARFTPPRLENTPPSELIADHDTLLKDFVERLHALVWCD